jgi:hypothetical protein
MVSGARGLRFQFDRSLVTLQSAGNAFCPSPHVRFTTNGKSFESDLGRLPFSKISTRRACRERQV